MSRRRERRAASLTAEALWNIQMQDDMGEKTKQQAAKNDGYKKIMLRENTKTADCLKPSTLAQPSFNKHSMIDPVSLSSELQQSKSQICMHTTLAMNSGNSKVYRSKGKLTASVAPLMKPGTRPLDSSKCPRRDVEHNITSVAGTSQVLLLPISLDTSGNSISDGNRTLPLLTLHASPLKVDLMHCFDRPARIVSPLVSVSSILSSGSGVHHSQGDFQPRICRFGMPASAGRCTSTSNDRNQNTSDQTEPLNLKLGESRIPNKSVERSVEGSALGILTGRSQILGRNSERLCTKFPSRPWQSSGHSMVTNEVHKDKCLPIAKIGSGIKFPNSSQFEELSHSSGNDSTNSSDHEDGSAGKAGKCRQKIQINLRCKAAPPPGQRPSVLDVCSSQDRRGRDIPRKRRRVSSESDSGENNGWKWDGKPYEAYVYSVKMKKPVRRQCYPALKRKGEDSSSVKTARDDDDDGDDQIMVHDCVMMRADGDQQPYVAKVAALWRHPVSKTVMISLLWYYRPEHTGDSRVIEQLDRYNDDELFASRHLDEISVECVEDKCYVLTYQQYCRFVAATEKKESYSGVLDGRDLIPPRKRSRDLIADRSMVYYCRRFYDIKLHRLLKSLPSVPNPLFSLCAPADSAQDATT